MPIKLPAKSSLSNKNQTLIKKADPPTSSSHQAAPQLYTTSTPFIDRISLVLKPKSVQDAHDIYNAVQTVLDDKTLFSDAGSKAKSGEYKLAKRIVLPSLIDPKKYPLFQRAHVDKSVTKLRLEFVPVDLGAEGMAELHAALIALVPDGWGYFIKHATITRLDIAVDFPAVRMGQVHLLPQQGATTKQWGVDGQLQTYTHGKPKGNQTSVYNRKAKRIAQKKPWTGKSGIRVERRFKMPPISKITHLPDLANPFTQFKMVGLPEAPPSGTTMPYVWDLFVQAANYQGLPAALALLPVKKRTAYRKHLAANPHPWWDPEAIWANWPKMLANTGMLPQ